ncbi:hypothetical protein FEM48_Zijuj08G0093500 [Ziziphus jujuba var. spinosa]|uniref:Methyltransferase PMT27 n=1 Tax=Ziziphus jujuba var. spinosa TaxID=714518 RepID=A0A978UYA0_ZIZJJ|nr:hypothetical protein FEM48_Zijuj08G0093500 [Ziziphus jujuba var. spinosa]
MALSKSRNNKRSSSNSYASTATTVLFIALCVLGVWMLTSNNVVPPQATTTRTATSTSTSTGASSSSSSNDLPQGIIKSADTKSFEDSPGELPDDALKADDSNKSDVSNEEQAKAIPAEEYRSSSSEQENEGDKQEEQAAIEEEKQKESQTQLSEESSMTQTQQVKVSESEENSKASSDEGGGTTGIEKVTENNEVQEQNSDSESGETAQENHDQQKPDEDQQQQDKILQQQLQEDENRGNSRETQNQTPVEDQQQPQTVQNEGDDQQQQQQQQQEQRQQADQDQKSSQESQNEISEDDQQKRVQQHKHVKQQKQQQENSESTAKTDESAAQDQSSQHEFTDVTNQQTDATQQSATVDQQQQQEPQQKKSGKEEAKAAESNSGETFPGGENSGIPKESKESKKAWSTQADQSENEKERRKDESDGQGSIYGYTWQLCNVTAGPDYIPCLDNEQALKHLHSTRHFEHRERHCPLEGPTCLVPLPQGYKTTIEWPQSRDKIWYHNVPHTKLAEVKGHQNWVKSVPAIAWGKRTRVILDVGCGVASFGGYLFERDVLTMSFAPKDEHEAQVQFALERGIPAISAVMGSQRLPFPSRVFDIVHCARCRVPWHAEGGLLLLELNRVLRPGGYFVWSATPVYQTLEEDVQIWKAMTTLTASMCWELVTIQKDKLNSIGAAIYRKPTTNQCYDERKQNQPPMCKNDDDPNAAWYVPLQACMHRVPVEEAERGTHWPEEWPSRLQTPPYWLNSSQLGIYGKPAPQDFEADYKHWKRVVKDSYMARLGISWSNVRNVMDMRAVYGGFAAALKDVKVWVMNVVNIDSPDTLPIIYERGLFGIYHDWCQSFSTYPRTYDLLHADHLFSKLQKRCKLASVMAEVDRIVRPGGKLIVRDESRAIGEVENLLKSLHWEVHLTFSKNQEGILSAQKGNWRPDTLASS